MEVDGNQNSVVGVVLELQVGWPWNLASIPGKGQHFFCKTSRLVLGPARVPNQWVSGFCSSGIKSKYKSLTAFPWKWRH